MSGHENAVGPLAGTSGGANAMNVHSKYAIYTSFEFVLRFSKMKC